jgi:hypothetical protein
MNPNEVLKLNDMIKEGDCVDNTDTIRQLKHSSLITQNLNTILRIKKKYNQNIDQNIGIVDLKQLDEECLNECRFLFDNYTSIYNKLLRDQIDLKVFYKFLFYLKKIEDGELTFYQASYEIGTLLKNMYVDPIVEEKEREKENGNRNVKSISWDEYKSKLH